jgi:hypothetical protein
MGNITPEALEGGMIEFERFAFWLRVERRIFCQHRNNVTIAPFNPVL